MGCNQVHNQAKVLDSVRVIQSQRMNMFAVKSWGLLFSNRDRVG